VSPRVSIVIATRDRRQLLTRARASVAAQSFRDFEIVVVDDGSTDGTGDWLRAHHPAVQLFASGTSRGAAAARNSGVAAARGAIIAFLDDDDAWQPAYLETQVRHLGRHPEAALSATRHVTVDGAGRVSCPNTPPLFADRNASVRLLAECPIHTLSQVACRHAVFDRLGPFDESLAVVHDLDWYVRLAAAGERAEQLGDALVTRSMPGGLVTQHRLWHAEEWGAGARWFAALAIAPRDRRRIRAARALFFAKLGAARGDLTFSLARLADVLRASPADGARIAARRLLQRRRRDAAPVATSAAWGNPT
jgi:glycosyltransferase involved in cell wall biosynthesis